MGLRNWGHSQSTKHGATSGVALLDRTLKCFGINGGIHANPSNINGESYRNISKSSNLIKHLTKESNWESIPNPFRIDGESDQEHFKIIGESYLTKAIGNPFHIRSKINGESDQKHFKINPVRIISKRNENPFITH